MRCRRCLRKIKSEKAIVLGYGTHCYKLMKLEQTMNTRLEDYEECQNND